MKLCLIFGCSLLALASSPAAAQQAAADDATITVLASGAPLAVDRSGQPVSVFSAAAIAAVQGADLTRLIERAPGVALVRNGGLGAVTSLFVRGAPSEQTLVLLDGVRLSDVSAPGGGTDLGTVSLGALGKAELLRGSNSVVWGSDAIGGVLALTSRAANGLEARIEGGAHGSFNGDAAAGITGAAGRLTLTGGYTASDGISAAATGREADGFRQARVAGTGELRLGGGLSLVASARHAWSHIEIDGYPPPSYLVFADTAEYQVTRQSSGRVGLRWRSAALDLDAGYALSDTRRRTFDRAQPAPLDFEYAYAGRSERFELAGRWRLPAALALDFGADRETSRAASTFDAEQRTRIASAHALLGFYGRRATLAAGVRIDDHRAFGSHVSLGANAALRLTEALRLTASYGEAFKTPSLFQLYSSYGNAALRPETSRSFDAGLAWGAPGGPAHLALTAFRRTSRDLIDYVSCWGVSTGICANRPYGTYANTGQTRAAGVEAELTLRPAPALAVAATFTHLVATDRTPGTANFGHDLARRPRTTAMLSTDWTSPGSRLTLGVDLRLVSRSFDDAANTLRLDGYQLVTLRARLPLGPRLALFGRIENLGNERYQTAAGYGTYRRSAYGGVEARW